MSKFFFFLFAFVFAAAAISSLQVKNEVPTLTAKDCEDPDTDINCCFLGMPDSLSHVMTIADSAEAGKRMVISGVVYKSDGKTPYPNVIIYAYHTDNTGHYSKRGNETGIRKWHGHLYGWCKTNDKGEYEIHSIRPAAYPSGGIPAHIHSAIREPNKEPYYINDFVFSDDKFVTEKYIANEREAGGSGVVTLTEKDGVLVGVRNLILKN